MARSRCGEAVPFPLRARAPRLSYPVRFFPIAHPIASTAYKEHGPRTFSTGEERGGARTLRPAIRFGGDCSKTRPFIRGFLMNSHESRFPSPFARLLVVLCASLAWCSLTARGQDADEGMAVDDQPPPAAPQPDTQNPDKPTDAKKGAEDLGAEESI